MFGWLFDVVDKVVDAVVDFVTEPAKNQGSNNGGAGRTNNITTKVATNNNKSNNTTSSNSNTNKTNNNVAGRTQQPSANKTTSTLTNRGNATPQNQASTSTSKPANTNTFGGTKIQNTVLLNNKQYDVYKLNDGTYYIIKDGEKKQLYGGMQLFTNLQNEDPVCVNITDENLVAGSNKIDKSTNTDNSLPAVPTTGSKDPSALPPLPNTNTNTGSSNNTSSNSTSSSTKPSTNSGTGSTSSGTTSNKTPSTNTGSNNTVTENPIALPVYEGAEAVAKAHGIDYNLANILADYNQRTNDYFDATVDEYEAERARYMQSSNNYANRIMNEYLDSYANSTATATNRGATAAAALMTDLNTQATNVANDMGMLQTVNNLNEARKAELVKNKFLAEQNYNALGTYLSKISTAEYGNEVNKYVKEMDAYAQRYAADRLLAEQEANSAAIRYAGLANASSKRAENVSSTYAWDRLYNYYLARYNGNEQMASSAVIKNLGTKEAGDK